jgi:hypothetical protein
LRFSILLTFDPFGAGKLSEIKHFYLRGLIKNYDLFQ